MINLGLLVGDVSGAIPDSLRTAHALAESATVQGDREVLLGEVAEALALQQGKADALAIADALPPGIRGTVLLTIAATLREPRSDEARKLRLDAQTARALTHDWRKARLSQLLVASYAKAGDFGTAEEMAAVVPDLEEKASALRELVIELCRAGDVAKARQIASGMEENRRYGTYRQKAAALAATARTLHDRGNPEDALTLLEQAKLLLPRKPGWSDGESFVAVALAAQACGEGDSARALLKQADELAHTIGGAWKVRELAAVATAYHTCGDAARATLLLGEAQTFLATLPPLERAAEAIPLARAWAAHEHAGEARATLAAIFKESQKAENKDVWRRARVHALVAWAELFGEEKAE